MKPEFEQLLKGLGILFYQDGTLETRYLDKLLFQELMENTWNLAIEAAADNAEADLTILSEEAEYELSSLLPGHDYEVCVITNSILKLKI